MTNLGIWKTIKFGFWVGIGFIIPQLLMTAAGAALTIWSIPLMANRSGGMESTDETADSVTLGRFGRNSDPASLIQIESQREQVHGNQLLILGSISNKGKRSIENIQLEAELFDDKGNFVYECSEYINSKLKPGAQENYQIRCGCSKAPLPDHSETKIRVVSAF